MVALTVKELTKNVVEATVKYEDQLTRRILIRKYVLNID